jgi:hypothetical protein
MAGSRQRTVRQVRPEGSNLAYVDPSLRKSTLAQSPVSKIELGFVAKALCPDLPGGHEKMATPAAVRIVLPWCVDRHIDCRPIPVQ